MNKRTKQAAGGLSIAGFIAMLVHIIHGFFAFNKPINKEESAFKNAPVTIITTDSITGKKDTLDMKTYLKQLEEKKMGK